MRKKLIGFLIAILVSLSSFSQPKQSVLDSINVPVWLIDSIADELAVKDGMEVTLQLQHRTLLIYAHKDSAQIEIIRQYRLNEQQYKQIIAALQELNSITEAERKDIERELKALRRKAWIATGAGVLLIILLL